MKKEIILNKLNENHKSFIDYLSNLAKKEFELSVHKKWTAGQQLEHIVLCVKGLVLFFSLDKATIEQDFGSTSRQGRSYEALLREYTDNSGGGWKAPVRYIPETNTINKRENLIQTLEGLIKELGFKIETFTEQELDSLQIPHPSLGILTLREMLYNAIYHVEHHLLIVQGDLKK